MAACNPIRYIMIYFLFELVSILTPSCLQWYKLQSFSYIPPADYLNGSHSIKNLPQAGKQATTTRKQCNAGYTQIWKENLTDNGERTSHKHKCSTFMPGSTSSVIGESGHSVEGNITWFKLAKKWICMFCRSMWDIAVSHFIKVCMCAGAQLSCDCFL